MLPKQFLVNNPPRFVCVFCKGGAVHDVLYTYFLEFDRTDGTEECWKKSADSHLVVTIITQ